MNAHPNATYTASKWGLRGLTKSAALECAQLALFLVSDEASFITGAEVTIDGGYTAGGIVWLRNKLRESLAMQENGA